MFFAEVIQGVRRFSQILHEFDARNPLESRFDALIESIIERHVRQFGDDDHLPVHDIDPL